MSRIPAAMPDLSGNEEKYVVDALRSTWISSTGPYLQRFEREFAELCQTSAAIYFQPVASWAKPAHWLFCITVNEAEYGCSRDELMRLLEKEGIATRPFFIPLHKLPLFLEESCRRNEYLP